MKRLTSAILPALILSFALLSSSCAPAPYMVATLTQLPFAATPKTATPRPTLTPRATTTPLPNPTVVEAFGSTLTTTPEISLANLTETATIQTACQSLRYDKTVPDPEHLSEFIGRYYDDRNPPAGIRWIASGMLETEDTNWAHVQVDGHNMYWIRKMVCRSASGIPYWKIVDALTLPSMDAEAHQASTDLCFNGDQEIPRAIAYGTYDPSAPAVPIASTGSVVGKTAGWPMKIEGAWQMADKFIPLKNQNLVCMVQKLQSIP